MKKRFLLLWIFIFLCLPAPILVLGQKQSAGQYYLKGPEIHVKEESPLIRNVKVSGRDGIYIVKGEASPATDSFYYEVEDGHRIFISEKYVTANKFNSKWVEFKININILKESLPDNGTLTMYFYEKNKKINEMTRVFPIILQRFY